MGNTRKVSEGLNLVYVGNMIAIIAALCTLLLLLIPVGLLAILVLIAILVGGVVCMVGLVKLRNEHEAYMSALVATVFGMIAGLLANDNSVFGNLMSLVQSVCNLLQIYFVVKATNSFLTMRGFDEQTAMGDKAWRWQLIGIAVRVITVLAVFIIPILAIVLALINIAVSIVALVFFLSYLKASAVVLS